MARPLLLTLLLAAFLPSVLPAQVIVGRVTEEGSAEPLDGAFLVLLDPAEERVGGVLTKPDGSYALRVPGAGEYRLLVERIGYRTFRSEPFSIAEQETLRKDLAIPTEAISLEGLTVQGEARCEMSDGGEVATLWEEARKALSVTAWADSSGLLAFAKTNFSRRLGPDARRVVSETRDRVQGWGRTPYESLPAEELAERGYVQEEGDELVYYAPDARVLLSDAFQETHCFELVREAADEATGEPRRIGLGFRPTEGREVPEIDGVLWLDPETAHLRSLDFRFRGLARRLGLREEGPSPYPWRSGDPLDDLGGEVHFEQLPNGAWMVREWTIRMPVVAATRDARGYERGRALTGVHEEGGRVEEVRVDDGELRFASRELGAVRGIVWDSTRSEPLVHASVFLSGTGYATRTDSLGTFVLDEVRKGEYTLTFDHPRVREVGIQPPEAEISVPGGGAVTASVGIPGATRVHLERFMDAAERCETVWEEDENPRYDLAAVTGRVRAGEQGPGVEGVTVTLEAYQFSKPARSAEMLQREDFAGTAVTDARGVYTFCNVPAEWNVVVEATRGQRTTGPVRVLDLAAWEVRQVDMVLGTGPATERIPRR